MSGRPIQGVADTARDLLALAREAERRARIAPADPVAMLSAFLLTYAIRDWSKNEGGAPLVENCPHWQIIREVANGSKHLVLDPKQHPDPQVAGIEKVGGFGMGPFGQGPYGTTYLVIKTHMPGRRRKDETFSMSIIGDALDWFEANLPA